MRERVTVVVAMGCWGAFLCYFALDAAPHHLAKDFTWAWRGARILLEGHDPYQVIRQTGVYPLSSSLFYPLPAVLVAMPVAKLPPAIAGAIFFGISSALLAFGLTREGFGRLLLFASAPFFMAAILCQWSPLMSAVAVVPAIRWLAVAKPTTGLAALLYEPSRRGIVGALIFLGICFIILPSWPIGWREAVATAPHHSAPILRAGGFVLLLALLRVKQREVRFLLALSCVPQVLLFYEQLPLWLLPTTFWRSLLLTATSWVAWFAWYPHHTVKGATELAEPWVMWLIYLPALALVLLPRSPMLTFLASLRARVAGAKSSQQVT